MSYLNDQILKGLKKTSKAKGLSQRELSAKSGVPQGHISKIENGAVDLRVSSLIALARTLDLELALVPRKAVPAVQSIVRQTINTDLMSTQRRAQEVIENYRGTINAILNVGRIKIDIQQKELDKFKKHINEISHLIPKINRVQLEAIQSSRKSIEVALKSGNTKKIKMALDELGSIRNSLANTNVKSITKTLPAYSLDIENDDE